MEELKKLIHRTQDEDHDAFGMIVKRFQDMAVGYAYSILGDLHLAEDVAQEAFIEAYLCLPKLREPDAFPSWFRKIVFKHCNRLTRKRRIETCPLEEADEVFSLEKGPSEIIEEQEMKADVLRAITELPEKQRMVTTLFYINGYSRKEIGEFLGVTDKTVKNHLYLARNRLRDRLITMVDDFQTKRALRNNQFANKEECELNMEKEIRIGTRRDYHDLVRLDAEWIGWFCQSHPASERWCPAMCRVPRIQKCDLLWYLIGKDDRWIVIYRSQGVLQGYILCRNDNDNKEVLIEGQTPRILPSLGDSVKDEVGKGLIQFVLRHGAEQKLEQFKMSFHGFPDEIDLLMRLYRSEGFDCEPWYEMLSHKLDIEQDPQRLQFRSAGEVGLDKFYNSEAIVGSWPTAEASKKDCEFSQNMWFIEPDTDWLMAYDDERLVGTIRVAVTREGLGVLDGIAIKKEYRGHGFGQYLLTRGLSALKGRTEVVWLWCIQDNTSAVRLYKQAGFKVHHEHGELTRDLER